MSYPAAVYMAPPSSALLCSKIHAVVFAGPVSKGESSFHTEPEENRAKPYLHASNDPSVEKGRSLPREKSEGMDHELSPMVNSECWTI